MKKFFTIACIVICTVFCIRTEAQNSVFQDSIPPFVVIHGDTVKTMVLRDVYIYPVQTFSSARKEEQYLKLIRDVKKTLPYAQLIYGTLIETYEYMMTLPNDKAREAHLKQMEKDLFTEYKPALKKLTLSQGKLLIKLIDRECNQSSYDILKAYLGTFRAGFWNLFAGLFGASLKSEWDPDDKDAATERIVQMVEMGLI
ncbi:MAG: DUF4294 domain-containing protein [Dysgonamonadaceae bacterium]|jgi:hypothetical protein|nr:DUF4294 domain-containing protein [Dysgonamonadaceae bacterium]